MHSEEDDFHKHYRSTGVSPLWQVFALLATLGAFLLFIIALALGAALVIAWREGRTANRNFVQPAVAVPADAERGWDPDEEPPNPPYPLEADLHSNPAEPLDAAVRKDHKTVRDRFVALGEALLWSMPEGVMPYNLKISPDGKHAAFLTGNQFYVGPIDGEPIAIRGEGPFGAPGLFSGRPAWSADGQSLYVADSEGGLFVQNVLFNRLERLGYSGDCPIPVGDRHLIYRRRRPRLKTDLSFQSARPDPIEVVMLDHATRAVRVLIPNGAPGLEPLCVSPDGRRLVVQASEPTKSNAYEFRQRLYLADLQGEGAVELKPIGPVYLGTAEVGWLADGDALLLAYTPQLSPPDRWESNGPRNGSELYHFDLATEKQTRLSRGGALIAFAGTAADDLFLYVNQQTQPVWTRNLRRVPLATLKKFADEEPERVPREGRDWTALFDRVLEEHCIPVEMRASALDAKTVAGLAQSFAAFYREAFDAEPPADPEAWDRLMVELSSLNLPQRNRAALVLGAAVGEYLRKEHGAVWSLESEPLPPVEPVVIPPTEESPFLDELNPFETMANRFIANEVEEDIDEVYVPTLWVRALIQQAEGRTIVMGNTAAALRRGVESLTDPDLKRASELFERKKSEEAEQLLLALLQKPKHTANRLLKLHVARMLCEEERGKAVIALLDPEAGRPLERDARVCNLLGLAVLETDPKRAVEYFHTALRCDLYFGAAYLNMAEAFRRLKNVESATLCLRRYLKLQPYGTYAIDARHRLARLQQEQDPLLPPDAGVGNP